MWVSGQTYGTRGRGPGYTLVSHVGVLVQVWVVFFVIPVSLKLFSGIGEDWLQDNGVLVDQTPVLVVHLRVVAEQHEIFLNSVQILVLEEQDKGFAKMVHTLRTMIATNLQKDT